MSPHYRRRQVIVEAHRVDAGDWDTCEKIAAWCGGQRRLIEDFRSHPEGGVIYIPATDGEGLFAMDGDYILHTGDGYYPIEPDVFAATYEVVAP
jgi:hypothetical protein